MRAALFLVGLAACGFDHGIIPDGGIGSGDGSGSDGTNCAWSYTPTNFDPCALPAADALTVSTNTTLDTASTTLPKLTVTQTDGTAITVIHLSQFKVDRGTTLTLNGTGVVFAVDGEAAIDGTVIAIAGSDNATQCAAARGGNGADSSNTNSGGGGGGGAAAAEVGGIGGAGEGAQAGAAGARGTAASSNLSPLRGGCPGGTGGRNNGAGTAPAGGRGGGALQISSNTSITVDGFLDAAGRGGVGAPVAKTAGGGGGSGGGILLEAPDIEAALGSRICADGGSGGEGGGITALGNNGQAGACTAIGAAHTTNTPNSSGGDGGDGGYLLSRNGNNGQNGVTGGAAGGAGGGGVGWIRIKSPNFTNNGAIITPVSTN